ncbi:MFS transporter [Tumebacillus flagellatus]|uniref:Major facilitator superfamily (MFS) profile domain-containing protein n=1 Tax=Tumebacillus flagellatus TaxID=1157490 RepID=A0A074LUC0_9BACL|nr:MFS transporter [Tumebacillus flagellatus]KEO83523.1 hypothetical protein EL26_09995 [Tumebacillus flagellatus]
MSSIVVLLKTPAFRKLFLADVFANFGNWFDFTALMVLIAYEWKMGAGMLAAFAIAQGAPMIVLGPLLSVWVDRLPLRNLMTACMVLRLLISVAFFFVPNFYILIVLVFLRCTLASIHFPARQAVIRQLVPADQVQEAVSLGQIILYTSQIVAPALGGALIPVIGVRNIFLLESVMLLLSTVFLAMLPNILRANESKNSSASGQNKTAQYFKELSEGLSHIRSNSMLFTSIILLSVGMLLVVLYDGLLVLWVKEMGLGESRYGTIVSALGLGSIVGAVLAGIWKGWLKAPMRIMSFTALLAGLLSAAAGFGTWHLFSLSWVGWTVVFLLFGAFGAAASIPYSYILQTETPQHLMGRVSSVSSSSLNAATIFGPGIGAFLAGYWGIGGVFVFSGSLLTLLALLIFLFINPRPKQA